MIEPKWSKVTYPEIDFQDMRYYSAPKKKPQLASLDEVDPELLETFNKLGISLTEQKRLSNVAVDAVFDSVSIATTFKEELAEYGVIFSSISVGLSNTDSLTWVFGDGAIPNSADGIGPHYIFYETATESLPVLRSAFFLCPSTGQYPFECR